MTPRPAAILSAVGAAGVGSAVAALVGSARNEPVAQVRRQAGKMLRGQRRTADDEDVVVSVREGRRRD